MERDWEAEFIRDEAARLRAEMQGATLFGKVIDLEQADKDTLLVAAYYAGENAEREVRMKYEDLRRELRGAR